MNSKEYEELYTQLDAYVKEHVNAKRYKHTLGVVKAAKHFALKYDVDVNKARIAAIFHDACKTDAPGLEHGEAAADLIQSLFHVTDEDIINAIRNHTIGRVGMSKLEKIIKLADLLEENRSYDDVPMLRAYDNEVNDLNKTYLKLIERQKDVLISRGINYDKRTDEVIEYIKKEIDNDK